MASPRMRLMMSAPPPAPKATMMRMGRCGQSWAHEDVGHPMSQDSATEMASACLSSIHCPRELDGRDDSISSRRQARGLQCARLQGHRISLGGRGAFHPQDLHGRRCEEDLAEGVHPVAGLIRRADAALAKRLELVEALQCDLELKGWPAVGTRQGNEDAGIQPLAARRLELMLDRGKRAIPVRRCDVIGEASEVHVSSAIVGGW